MISSYCRPSSRPPEPARDLPKQGKVSFAEAENASPRCAAHDVFLGLDRPPVKAAEFGRRVDEETARSEDGGPQPMEEDEETPAEVALLLTAVADIAKREIKADPPIASALAEALPFPDLSSPARSDEGAEDADDSAARGSAAEVDFPALLHFDHKKARAVSVDFPELRAKSEPWAAGGVAEPLAPPPSPPHEDEAVPTLLQWRNLRGELTSPPHQHGIFSTPPPSPLASSRRRHARQLPHSDYRRSGTVPGGNRPRSISLAEGGGAIEQIPVLDLASPVAASRDGKPMKLILRKKFSWKNYPELEEFLVANREEYLRHSTLNYTVQQKKYNNCLTRRMIELAAAHGYAFDESEFNFVTVRDRIRCYYKSYVQSMKKRGVVIGYAARKAGLVTEEELEESAHTSGKIFVPKH
ncbi:hypothetical protein ACHAWF_011079 [Thalassiosira exigua]